MQVNENSNNERAPLAGSSYQRGAVGHDGGSGSSEGTNLSKKLGGAIAIILLMGVAFLGGEWKASTPGLRGDEQTLDVVWGPERASGGYDGASGDTPMLGGFRIECLGDRYCPSSETPPGELPEKYCYFGQCSAWENGFGIPREGYPIWIPTDAENGFYSKVLMPRTVMPEGPAMSQVWHWDLNDQPEDIQVTYNGTHVVVPLFKQMLAGYSRSYHFNDEHEAGIVTAAFLPNPLSVVTDKPKAGMIEKYHTLTYNGKWSEVRADRIKALGPLDNVANETWDRVAFRGRGDSMSTLFGIQKTIDAQVEGGIDKGHLLHMRMSAADPTTPVANLDSPGWKHHRDIAEQAPAEAKTKSSMKSENHCKHFEEGWGVEYNDTHIILPVGSAIVTLSGEMVYSPTYYLGFNGGSAFVDYDPDTNVLQIYYEAYQASRQYTDPKVPTDQWPYPSGIWVSSPGPNHPVSPIDTREDKFLKTNKPMVGPVLGLVNLIKVDYSVYARSKDVTCPPEFENALNWSAIDLPSGAESPWETLLQTATLFQVANDGAPCGKEYMVPDFDPHTSGYEINEFGVWNHLLLEVDAGHTKELATASWWNDWDEFYKSKE